MLLPESRIKLFKNLWYLQSVIKIMLQRKFSLRLYKIKQFKAVEIGLYIVFLLVSSLYQLVLMAIFFLKNMELWTLNIVDNTYLQHCIEKISTVNGCAAY